MAIGGGSHARHARERTAPPRRRGMGGQQSRRLRTVLTQSGGAGKGLPQRERAGVRRWQKPAYKFHDERVNIPWNLSL